MTTGLLELLVLAASRDSWSSLLSARMQSLARMDAGPPIRVSLGGTCLRSPVSRVPNESPGEQEVVDLKATQPRSCDSEVSCLLFEPKEMALPKKEKRRCLSRRQYLQDASCLNRILTYKNDFVEAP